MVTSRPMPEAAGDPFPPSTKTRLVLTAERLFATRGIEGVSLRQIGLEAGSANNGAVHYHFGSKEALIQAIFLHRLPPLEWRRRLLEARASAGDLRAVLEARLLPVVEQAEDPGSHYLSFVEQLVPYRDEGFLILPEPFTDSHDRFVEHVASLLPTLPAPLPGIRIHLVSAMCLHACADRERARHRGSPLLPFAVHAAHLFDGFLGFLQTPPSRTTLDALSVSAASMPAGRPVALP